MVEESVSTLDANREDLAGPLGCGSDDDLAAPVQTMVQDETSGEVPSLVQDETSGEVPSLVQDETSGEVPSLDRTDCHNTCTESSTLDGDMPDNAAEKLPVDSDNPDFDEIPTERLLGDHEIPDECTMPQSKIFQVKMSRNRLVQSFGAGDRVEVWSEACNEWISDGVVLDVVDAARAAEDTSLQVGSVTVSCRGDAEKLIVRPTMLRKLSHVAPAVAATSKNNKELILPLAAMKVPDVLGSVMKSYEVGSSLFKTFCQKVVEDTMNYNLPTVNWQLPDFRNRSSTAGSLLDGNESRSRSSTAGSLLDKDESSGAAVVAECDGDREKSVGFSIGERVHVWDSSRKEWETDAVIVDVLQNTVTLNNIQLPMGSVTVSIRGGAQTMQIIPQLFDYMLRRVSGDRPQSAPCNHTSPPPPPVAADPWMPASQQVPTAKPNPPPYERSQQRLLVIGSGFGLELNRRQFAVIQEAGFQVHCITNLPNPELPGLPMMQFLQQIKQVIDEYRPNLVACASKGSVYMTGLLQMGLWNGPTLMINRHPSLAVLPKNINIVLAHGSNDPHYRYTREDLEALMQSGSKNRCLLYYTANSGLLGQGYSRQGDEHNMASLQQYDCLPRLIDAALCPECMGGPETQLMRSWREMVTENRIEAEEWLGYDPSGLQRLWQSRDQKGLDDQILFEVPVGSEEHRIVSAIFRAMPKVPRAYHDMNPGMWEHVNLLKVERVENGYQQEGNAKPYFKSLQTSVEAQGLEFCPGLHTRWVFHGSSAVDAITADPIAGFQPLLSGSRASTLWGAGTYFARDAKYVYDGGFCNTLPDGRKQILLCLLMTGMVCLGDPRHQGVLPVRQGRHRYNSSVDSFSNPEIFVTQSPGAAYPAYVFTFG